MGAGGIKGGGIFTGGRGSVDSSRIKRGGRCEGLRVLGRGKRAKNKKRNCSNSL